MTRVDHYWSDRFGLTDELNRPGIHVVAHPRYSGDDLILTLVRNDVAIMAAAPSQVDAIGRRVRTLTPERLLQSENYPPLVDRPITRYAGPFFEGFVDDQSFRPVVHNNVVRLDRASLAGVPAFERACDRDDSRGTPVWRDVVDRFIRACDSTDVEQSGVAAADSSLFAAVEHSTIMALARYSMWARNAASIGVVTHPKFRRSGHGKSVVSAAIADALSQEHLILYRTLLANRASVALATSLGCQDYGRYFAVHLKTAA